MDRPDALMDSLPDEVRAAMGEQARLKAETLSDLGAEIARLRDEAKRARKESGIEDAWMQAEEDYLGIDDLNRSEFQGARWAKPMSMEGPLTKRSSASDEVKATAFVKVAARYVDAGSAKLAELAIPVDGKPFALKQTPVPEMVGAAENKTPAEAVTGVPMPGADGQPVTVADLAKHAISEAEKKASKAADRIFDWLTEAGFAAELRNLIFDGARIGCGVLHGPVAEVSRAMAVRRDDQGIALEFVQKTQPAGRALDPWCFYPAPGCGEDIHKGPHAFYVETATGSQLMDLADSPTELGYLRDGIMKVLKEGPNKVIEQGGGTDKPVDRHQFERWVFAGKVKRSAFEAANESQAQTLQAMQGDQDDETAPKVDAIVELVNDTVIRAVLHPLESGRLPFHVFKWRKRKGHWAGVGVAEQVRTPGKIVTAATRALLNNGGKSSGSQVVMDPSAVEPANRDMQIVGDKLWWLKKDSGVDDVRKVFAAFQWPNTTQQMLAIAEFGFKLAEEHSSIPLITQGQSGPTTPDTFGGQQLQDNNANQLLRDIGFSLSDDVVSPFVTQLYEWLLLDPDVPDDEKGDFKVDVSGAKAAIEKALKDRALIGILGMDPMRMKAYGIDPRAAFAAWCRANRLVADEFQYAPEKLEEMDKQPPPKAPAVEAAEIRRDGQLQAAQMANQTQQARIAADTDRDTAYTQSLTERARSDAQAQREELALRRELAMLDYANKHQMTIEALKAQLAQTTMKLQVQKELSDAAMAVDVHKHHNPAPVIAPPTEPAGRADPGKAFEE